MIYLIDLESVESRYTSQWKEHFPKMIKEQGLEVTVIDGPEHIAACTTPGAFLNFSGTNVYKSVQVEKFSKLFSNNEINPGDHFVFADAWHPGIINLKYMSELLNVPIKIHALWHAGSYDPADFLGRLIGDARWVRNFEKSLFEAIDFNYFATDFHIRMFFENLLDVDERTGRIRYMPSGKVTRAGWPMEYVSEQIQPAEQKENIVLFPHRLAPEKQVDIFNALSWESEYEFITCQDKNLTKDAYHKLLARSKVVFSANLQETLGISCYEILHAGGIPLVPDRLSYTEMYPDIFKYPSEWTTNAKNFLVEYKTPMKEKLQWLIENFDSEEVQTAIETTKQHLSEEYFSANNIYKNLGAINAT